MARDEYHGDESSTAPTSLQPFNFEVWNNNKPRTFLFDGVEIKIVSVRFFNKNIETVFYRKANYDGNLYLGDEEEIFMDL